MQFKTVTKHEQIKGNPKCQIPKTVAFDNKIGFLRTLTNVSVKNWQRSNDLVISC